MISKEVEKILAEIFDPSVLADDLPKDIHFKPPTFMEIQEIAQLVYEDKSEETYQRFLSKHPHFLFRGTPWSGDYNCGLLIKPPISNFFNADFAIFTVGQGGCGITLVEIEKPSDKLFTKKLTPARKLQTAIGQIDDWNEWLISNKQTFVNTGLELLRRAPLFPKKSINGSFKTMQYKEIENSWRSFGGFDNCHIANLIIIGRWSKLSEGERKRLLFLNSKTRPIYFQIRTYDQLIRKGYDGPPMYW